ncbi:galactokinase [Vallitalea guaymasensis]|uniref:Galactokinase n=1 Tax=Vallitalea guaymasensis TaxID=1185412 RepID=A0A8J8MA40_9FIRM|nr:galactokinase [Vallitalea guaymasensis]QUH29159.1 galactokinase [Vallitalea guaymasensis]
MEREIVGKFVELYGGEVSGVDKFFAPGRVNLIGEHIDYNGGYVFPCALDFGTYAAARKRDDGKVRFATLNFDLRVEIDIEDIRYRKEDDWTNYPKGVIKEFIDMGHEVGGFDILYYGNIPNGSGLSSSASLEVLTAVVVNELFDCKEDMVEMVKMSQRAENQFVGVNCGIMDQFASGMGKLNHAILLDCETLDYEYAPLKLDGYKIVIGNTKKRRGLADSKYNERRSECQYALECIQKELDIKNLCEMDVETFDKYKHLIDKDVPRDRAKHAVEENVRVKEAVEALNEGDIITFGKLMNASHESLRDLYEVTGVELDTMVEEARKIEGTIGSRMTGAGFGGCTVSIVKEDSVDEFIRVVGKNYEDRIGLVPEFYVANVGDGAGRIK